MKNLRIRRLPALDYAGQESLSSICSNLSFVGRDVKKIVFSSVAAGAGKSYLTLQVAANLGKRGNRVVLVDADMRRSCMVRRYGIVSDDENMYGLAHHLAGYSKLEDVVYATDLPGVSMVPVGRNVADPVPLLDSVYFEKLMQTLSERFDLVLVDSPPVGLVIDAAEIARDCDGCVLMAEYNRTRLRDLAEAEAQIEESGCPVLGYVINKVSFTAWTAKQGYNKYYYSYKSSDSGRRGSGRGKER